MVPRNERAELVAAWRALSNSGPHLEGWRTIALGGSGNVYAGRKFPDNNEAVIFAFSDVSIPPQDQMPQGKGFVIASVQMPGPDGRQYLAVVRRSEGNLDMFTTMVVDVIESARSSHPPNEQTAFRLFVTRIRAWQEFMRRGGEMVLGPSAEIGLFGELLVLERIIGVGAHPSLPIDGWEGPLDGLHDFVFGTGAIEVKSTIATGGFTARIDSLDQLDDGMRQPLFLACVSLNLTPAGRSLPDLIGELRTAAGDDPSRAIIDSKLIRAGFLDVNADQYKRRFVCSGVQLFGVTEKFPRITRASVPPEVVGVTYDLSLDSLPASDLDLRTVLHELGVV